VLDDDAFVVGIAQSGQVRQLRHQVQAVAVAPHVDFRMRYQRLRVLAGGQQLRHHLFQPGGGRHVQVETPKPVAQQVVDAVRTEQAQACQVDGVAIVFNNAAGRQVLFGQLVQQALGRLRVRAAARDAPLVAREGLGQHRHHLVAQGVAGVARIAIGFIFDPGDVLFACQRFQFGPRYFQQRPRHHQRLVTEQAWGAVGGLHARQAGRAGTAQQLQQHGLGLVVEVMGGEQQLDAVGAAHLAQGRVAQLAGSRFDAAFPLPDRDVTVVEGDAERGRSSGAVIAPAIGIRAQPMVDVEGEQRHTGRLGCPMRQMQQHHGIEAATEGDRDG
jgi:hypothetical protein